MKRTHKIIFGILAGVAVFILAVILGTWGSMAWRKAAQYPPPMERPSVRASIALEGRSSESMGLVFSSTSDSHPPHEISTSWGQVVVSHQINPPEEIDAIYPPAGSMHGIEPVNGFLEFMHALFEAEFELSDIAIQFPQCTLADGSDENQWIFKDSIETRIYNCESPIQMMVDRKAIIDIPVTQFTCILDYRGASKLSEVRVTGMTDIVIPIGTADINESARYLSEALLKDAGDFKMRLVIENMILHQTSKNTIQTEPEYWGDILSARLEIIP